MAVLLADPFFEPLLEEPPGEEALVEVPEPSFEPEDALLVFEESAEPEPSFFGLSCEPSLPDGDASADSAPEPEALLSLR